MIWLRVATLLMAVSSTSMAGTLLCPAPKQAPAGEGIGGPIPESAFTAKQAQIEMDRLRDVLKPSGVSADAIAWQNSFVYIEGWLLRRDALQPVGQRHPSAVADFCEFMKTRAYLRD